MLFPKSLWIFFLHSFVLIPITWAVEPVGSYGMLTTYPVNWILEAPDLNIDIQRAGLLREEGHAKILKAIDKETNIELAAKIIWKTTATEYVTSIKHEYKMLCGLGAKDRKIMDNGILQLLAYGRFIPKTLTNDEHFLIFPRASKSLLSIFYQIQYTELRELMFGWLKGLKYMAGKKFSHGSIGPETLVKGDHSEKSSEESPLRNTLKEEGFITDFSTTEKHLIRGDTFRNAVREDLKRLGICAMFALKKELKDLFSVEFTKNARNPTSQITDELIANPIKSEAIVAFTEFFQLLMKDENDNKEPHHDKYIRIFKPEYQSDSASKSGSDKNKHTPTNSGANPSKRRN